MQNLQHEILSTLVRCARRELALRQNVYPKWVQAGRMTETTARQETADMQAVANTLESLREAHVPFLRLMRVFAADADLSTVYADEFGVLALCFGYETALDAWNEAKRQEL